MTRTSLTAGTTDVGREVLEGIHYTGWIGLAVDITAEDVVASRIDQDLREREVRMEEEARAVRKKAEHERRARMLLLQNVRIEYALARSKLRIRTCRFYMGCILLVLVCFTAYAFFKAVTDPAKATAAPSTQQVHP